MVEGSRGPGGATRPDVVIRTAVLQRPRSLGVLCVRLHHPQLAAGSIHFPLPLSAQ